MEKIDSAVYDLFCPLCKRPTGDKGQKTELYSQYIAYCKVCKCQFTVYYFKYLKKEVHNG